MKTIIKKIMFGSLLALFGLSMANAQVSHKRQMKTTDTTRRDKTSINQKRPIPNRDSTRHFSTSDTLSHSHKQNKKNTKGSKDAYLVPDSAKKRNNRK